jgi:hypothetical protein
MIADPQFALDVSGIVRVRNQNGIINVQSGNTSNFGVGFGALPYVTSGGFNTAIGFNTLGSITTGSNNTAIGYNSFTGNNFSQSTAIGYGSQPTANNQIVLGTSSESVIIPGTTLSSSNTTGALQVAGGVGVGGSMYVGGNIFVNGALIVPGGGGAGGPGWAISQGGNVFYNGSVGIGKADPQYTLDVSGTVYVTGSTYSTYFITTSDYRIKVDQQPLDLSYSIDKLNPIRYINTLSQKEDLGFIAHEVQEVFPNLVDGEKDGEKMQSLNYIGLIAVLVKEVQELKKTVEILKNKQRSMQDQINILSDK